MLNSNLGGGIPGYMGESGVKATSPTDPHLSDPHAAANEEVFEVTLHLQLLRRELEGTPR